MRAVHASPINKPEAYPGIILKDPQKVAKGVHIALGNRHRQRRDSLEGRVQVTRSRSGAANPAIYWAVMIEED
jgi:hypothetical protein